MSKPQANIPILTVSDMPTIGLSQISITGQKPEVPPDDAMKALADIYKELLHLQDIIWDIHDRVHRPTLWERIREWFTRLRT